MEKWLRNHKQGDRKMSPRRLESIVNQFYNMVSQPVKYASLFYVYYYLVEVENVRELKRKFVELRNELEEVFWNYGLFVIADEIRHLTSDMDIKTEHFPADMAFFEFIEPYVERVVTDEKWREVLGLREDQEIKGFEEYIFKKMEVDMVERGATRMQVKKCIGMFWSMYDTPKEYSRDGTLDDILLGSTHFEKKIGIFSNPSIFLEASNLLLSLGYRSLYGGEAWNKIVRMMMRRSNTTPTIFVDACFGIEHQSNLWVDMIVRDKNEINKLRKVLDENMDGNLNVLFDIAVKHDAELEKYRRFFEG